MSRSDGRGRAALSLLALTALTLSLQVGPAAAGGLKAPQASVASDATAPAQVVADTGQNQVTEQTCQMYGSSNGYGMVCTDPAGGGGSRSLVSYLEGRPLPECWDEPAPEGYRGAPRDDPGSYWLRTCLRGLDRTTLLRTGKLELGFTIVHLPPGQQVILTPGQETVIRYFFGSGQIPFPVLATSPSVTPRAQEPVTFGLYAPTSTPPLTTQGVTMYAKVVQLQVDPGDGSPLITCRGPGELLTRQQLADPGRADADTVCKHSYERSSADAGTAGPARDRYPARVTAFWQIRYRTAGGERVLGTYEKSSVNQVRVTEVQTLVIS